MIEVYVRLVQAGRRALMDVPQTLRDAVAQRLEQLRGDEGN